MRNMVSILFVYVFYLAGAAVVVFARPQGDKVIVGGEGCGPKFIYKSGSRHHKEFFILNECKDDRDRAQGSGAVPMVQHRAHLQHLHPSNHRHPHGDHHSGAESRHRPQRQRVRLPVENGFNWGEANRQQNHRHNQLQGFILGHFLGPHSHNRHRH